MKKIGSFVVLLNQSKTKVFLVKRSDFPVWEIQGGGIEKKETPEKTAIREAFEETGFKIKITRKVANYFNKDKLSAHLFEGKIVSGKYKPEYKGCVGKWFYVKNLPKEMTKTKQMMIEDSLLNKMVIIKKEEPSVYSLNNIHLLLINPKMAFKYLLNQIGIKIT